MERRRILLIGRTKECVFRIRSLLDGQPYELEIALGESVARSILRERYMHMIIFEPPGGEGIELYDFLLDRGLEIPVLLVGEHAEEAAAAAPPECSLVKLPSPLTAEELVAAIRAATTGSARVRGG